MTPLKWAISLGLIAAFIFYLTTSAKYAHFDYTHRLAVAMLKGRVGMEEHPSWLNELISIDGGRYYTGNYCFGAVLSMIPFLFLPVRCLIALLAGTAVFCFFLLGGVNKNCSTPRRIMFALLPIFGTWFWTSLGMGEACQLTQAFALIGQAGALYFTLVRPMPLAAGAFFALAFGNRAELILTIPIYLFLMRRNWRDWFRFLILPVALALMTAEYNYARFGNPFEFGYHRQHLMLEGRCQLGLFSLYHVWYNVYHMLLEGFYEYDAFPYMRPSPWGCSIFLVSPFLFLLFREGGKYKVAAWSAIGLLVSILWCHCSQGGYDFSTRYAIILLPWMFLILANNGKPNGKLSANEAALFTVSIAINAAANYLFLWTDRMGP